jgi:hypothetical protein
MAIVSNALSPTAPDVWSWAAFLPTPDTLISHCQLEFDFYVPPSSPNYIAYELDGDGAYIYIDNWFNNLGDPEWAVNTGGVPTWSWTPDPDNMYHVRAIVDRLTGALAQVWLTKIGDTETVNPTFSGVRTSSTNQYGAHGIGMEYDGAYVAVMDNIAITELTSFTADSLIIDHFYFRADAILFKEQSGTFTANAVIKSLGFTADAVLVNLPATRFYLEYVYSPNITPAYSAGWNATSNAKRSILWPLAPQDSSGQTTAAAFETSASEQNVLLMQYVTGPLPAQTIGGLVRGWIAGVESVAAAEMRLQTRIKVVSEDGATERGVLYEIDNAAFAEEFPAGSVTTSAHRSRRLPLGWSGQGATLNPVVLLEGDRVVVEIGFRSHNLVTTSYTGSLARNSLVVGMTDHAAYDEVATNRRPWIEFTDIDLPPVVPTRLYISSQAAPPVTHAYHAEWDATSHAVRKLMATVPGKVRSPRLGFEAFETSSADNYDQLNMQIVSGPLMQDTLIDGYVKAMIMAAEDGTSDDLQSQTVIRVIADDGTVRGTLVSADTATTILNEWTASFYPSGGGSEKFPRNFPTPEGTPVTPVSALAGDRIVVEVGSRTTTARSIEQRGMVTVGAAEAEVNDFNENVGSRETARKGWIEFSNTLLFDERWFLADAVIKRDNSGVFTADATIADRKEATFTADAILKGTVNPGTPSIRAVTSNTAGGTSKTLTMPTTLAGDLVLAFWTVASNALTTDLTPPSGWDLVDIQSPITAQQDHIVFKHIATGVEPASYTFTLNLSRTTTVKTLSIANANDVKQILKVKHDDAVEDTEITTPVLTTEHGNSLVLASFHGDNTPDSVELITPTDWTISGTAIINSNAWTSVYYKSGQGYGTSHSATLVTTQPFIYGMGAFILEVRQVGVFYADAFLRPENNEYTFTANAVLQSAMGFGDFTADAIIKRTVPVTWILANAYILLGRIPGTFTADAVLQYRPTGTFRANAYLVRPQIDPAILAARTVTGLRKKTTMHVLTRRERPLDAFVPPRIPDEPEDTTGEDVPCLPPCPPVGAGFGNDYGVGAGAAVQQDVVRCTECNVLWGIDTDYMGRSPSETSTGHAGCESTHNKSAHVTRLWVAYPSVPTGQSRMRAKLTWDASAGDSVTVDVYGNVGALPNITADTYEPFDAGIWDDGELVGKLTFIRDNSGSIDGVSSNYQLTPSEITIDSASLSTNVFRFQLHNEGTAYLARFKASNVEIVTD